MMIHQSKVIIREELVCKSKKREFIYTRKSVLLFYFFLFFVFLKAIYQKTAYQHLFHNILLLFSERCAAMPHNAGN